MGWMSDDGRHEGFTVALVERDGVTPGSQLYRELQYPGDDVARDDVAVVQAGCECGWRSRYLRLPARWTPCSALLECESDERTIYVLWAAHVTEELSGS